MFGRSFARTLFPMLAVLALLVTGCVAPAPAPAAPAPATAVPAAAEPTAAPAPAEPTKAPEAPAAAAPAGEVTTITFWHAMSGSREKVVNELAESFNALHPDMKVEPQLIGSYAETLTKALAAYKTGSPPTIVQVYEVGTRTMLDSDAVIPVYTLDKGEVNWDEVVQPIMKYYSVEGKLSCMPFNSSTAMLYYNKDMFAAAGLDPEKPPATWAEVETVSKKLMEAGVAKGGFSMGWPAWIFEQEFALHDQLYADNDNGRAGLATKILFNSDFGVSLLTEWQRMAKEGVLVYGGREYSANDPFLAGQFGMLFQSTSSLGGIIKSASFKVGTAFLPRLDGFDGVGNSVIGGGCNWVMKGATEAQQKAAWEFLKYSFTPERSVIWHKQTGYFPTSLTAYDDLKKEGWFEAEPNHATAFNQILSGANTPAATGVVLGDFVQIRDITGAAIEEVVVNFVDPKQALTKAETETNQVLGDYAEMHPQQ